MKKPAAVLVVFVLVPALAALLYSCAPNAPSDAVKQGGIPKEQSVSVEWSKDSDCSVCHVPEQESYSDSACLASLHPDTTCSQCHADSTELSSVHEGKTASDKMPKKLKKTSVSDDLCLSCHFETKDALAEATPDVLITDSKGNSRNPHLADGVVEHEDIECAECHSMHVDEPIEDQAKDKCYSCHHAEVFECYTCHE